MKKMLLLLLCIAGVNFASDAQKPFQNISFERALQKAKKENKIVFLQFDSDECIQCTEVSDKAFSDEDFAKRLAEEFIAINIKPLSKDRVTVGEKYNISEGFGTLFIDGSGDLIHIVRSTFSTPKSYEKEIQTAYERQHNYSVIEKKEKSYFQDNNKNVHDLEQLIQAKTDLGLSTDLLLSEYINLTPKDSLNTLHTVQFLIRQAPLYLSKAYEAMTSAKNYKEAWFALPAPQRVKINDEIFRKSIKVAAKSRDEALAITTARASMSTAQTSEARQNTYEKNMMSFYSQTKDTNKYFTLAIPYYDRYVKNLTPEFLSRMDSVAKSNAFKNPEKIIAKPMEDGKQLQMRTARYISPNSTYSNYLFRVANYFNHFDASNKHIEHTISYARKSVELSAQPNNMHLLAEILYKNHQTEEAIKYMERAIALSKERSSERKEWIPIVEKMKAGMPLE